MQNITEKQRAEYNMFRAEGMAPEKALMLATKNADNQFNPAIEKGVDNILFGKDSLTDNIVRGVGEAAFGGIREINEDRKEYGGGFAAAKAPLTLLAGVGRGAGKIFGSAVETADDVTGEFISQYTQPALEKAVESDVGQYLLENAVALDKDTRGIAGDLLDVTELFGIKSLLTSGTTKSIKNSILQNSKKAFESGGDAIKGTDLKSFFKKPTLTPKPKTPEAAKDAAVTAAATAEDNALKAAAELLQSGSKKSATGRADKYNNADIQAMKAIRDSDVELKSQQDLADFFNTELKAAIKERDALLAPFLQTSVDDSFTTVLKAEIKKLRVAGDIDDATKYAQVLKKEMDQFNKIAKAAPGGRSTVEQLSNHIKEINKKVEKLYNDAGGKENLLPDQKIEAQAYELLRQGMKKKLDAIAGDAYKEAGIKTSGLIDAQTFSRIQRDRAKNALTGTPWEKMTPVQRAAFVKDFFPTLKDFGVSKLVKLDTKADVLDALVAEKVRLIREFGADAVSIE